jgi:predicted transglutaminase-like cysteine proteinase
VQKTGKRDLGSIHGAKGGALCLLNWLRFLFVVLPLAAVLAAEMAVITDVQIAKLGENFGPVAKQRLTAWRDILVNPKYKAMPENEKLEFVNNFMNQTPFIADIQHWGKEDYWATPIEFLSTNGGDCEDFSIAKYFTLRALGVADEKLRITYVKELVIFRQAHMVLAYFPTPDAEPLILDNIDKRVLPAGRRTDLLPVYSFNGSGLWLAKEQSGRAQSVGGSDRIGHWKDLRSRMSSAL